VEGEGFLMHVPVLGSTLLAAAMTLLIGSAAAAAPGERLEYNLQFSGVQDCGTFVDNWTTFYHIVETDELDADGNLLRAFKHVEHHEIDVNSVTGFTIYLHGAFHAVDDYVAGTFTATGNRELATIKGTGVVVQDTGKEVTSMQNGDLLFFAGGRKHSNDVQGEQIYCDALS
jgi:hypothetical protein